MICVVCKHGQTQPATVTVTLERDNMTLVVKGVPASVCANCGEEYLDEQITAQLVHLVEEASRSGVQVAVRQYIAA